MRTDQIIGLWFVASGIVAFMLHHGKPGRQVKARASLGLILVGVLFIIGPYVTKWLTDRLK
jgi:hypothetical protein